MSRYIRILVVIGVLTLLSALCVQEHATGNQLSYQLNRSLGEMKRLAEEQRELLIAVSRARRPDHILAKAAEAGLQINPKIDGENIVRIDDAKKAATPTLVRESRRAGRRQ
ncbi:MAG: hypothetical protein A2Z34_07520 [Planctomycetes bacterium RBG_16_59_8]|nr:MAG: hypothetical protein A2Z34_07520 [Planctomycetes bacterium RBG_16_59_8]